MFILSNMFLNATNKLVVSVTYVKAVLRIRLILIRIRIPTRDNTNFFFVKNHLFQFFTDMLDFVQIAEDLRLEPSGAEHSYAIKGKVIFFFIKLIFL